MSTANASCLKHWHQKYIYNCKYSTCARMLNSIMHWHLIRSSAQGVMCATNCPALQTLDLGYCSNLSNVIALAQRANCTLWTCLKVLQGCWQAVWLFTHSSFSSAVTSLTYVRWQVRRHSTLDLTRNHHITNIDALVDFKSLQKMIISRSGIFDIRASAHCALLAH